MDASHDMREICPSIDEPVMLSPEFTLYDLIRIHAGQYAITLHAFR